MLSLEVTKPSKLGPDNPLLIKRKHRKFGVPAVSIKRFLPSLLKVSNGTRKSFSKNVTVIVALGVCTFLYDSEVLVK